MIGRGRGAGGISFLNGLFSGEGAAAGVELFACVEVELTPADARPESSTGATTLAHATLTAALAAWSGEPWSARLTIRSEVPPSSGLKSSSAVSTAVEHAVLDALGKTVPAEDVAALGSRVALEGGFSATGAFDDAMASVTPGIHRTLNAQRYSLSCSPVPAGQEVVLWIPRAAHAPSPAYRARFAAERETTRPARQAAALGDWATAMRLNSEAVERTMGYEYAAVRSSALTAGAWAAGVSGMGPALAAVVPKGRLAAVLRTLPRGRGDVIVTRFLAEPTGAIR